MQYFFLLGMSGLTFIFLTIPLYLSVPSHLIHSNYLSPHILFNLLFPFSLFFRCSFAISNYLLLYVSFYIYPSLWIFLLSTYFCHSYQNLPQLIPIPGYFFCCVVTGFSIYNSAPLVIVIVFENPPDTYRKSVPFWVGSKTLVKNPPSPCKLNYNSWFHPSPSAACYCLPLLAPG